MTQGINPITQHRQSAPKTHSSRDEVDVVVDHVAVDVAHAAADVEHVAVDAEHVAADDEHAEADDEHVAVVIAVAAEDV